MLIHRVLLLPALLFTAAMGSACVIMIRQPVPVDFLSFWAAGKLALEGSPAAAYDLVAHLAVETDAIPFSGLLPFPYPPALLFLLMPFGWLSVGPAFVAWTVVTLTFYLFCVRLPFRMALAHPAVVANGLIGQVAFLTTGIFALGCALLRSRPFASGAVLGLLSIKPQIAVAIPVALIAGRQWRALCGATCSSAGLLALPLIAFGTETLTGFLHMLPRYTDYVATGKWEWNELASLYATAIHAGAAPLLAIAIHSAGTAFGLWCVVKAWTADHEAKVPILAAASLLVPPYLLNYDALFLVIPFAWLLRRNPLAAVITWLLALVPVILDGLNPLPLAALISLVVMLTDRGPAGRSGAAKAPEAISETA